MNWSLLADEIAVNESGFELDLNSKTPSAPIDVLGSRILWDGPDPRGVAVLLSPSTGLSQCACIADMMQVAT